MARNCAKMNLKSCLFSLIIWISTLGGVLSRVVSVPPGPLIRVEGQPVSIRCDVTDYGGPDEQDFEWVMTRTQSGAQIKIISTFDTSYSHPSLSRRVASGDISNYRLKDNEVELRISNVRSTDSGFYNCQTPSTDSEIRGNYEAKVELIGRKSDNPLSPDFVPSIFDYLPSPEKRRRNTRLEVFNRRQKAKMHKTEQAKLSAEATRRLRMSTDCPPTKDPIAEPLEERPITQPLEERPITQPLEERPITGPLNDSDNEDPVQPDPATPPCTSASCGKRIQCLELECQALRTENMLLRDKINRKTLTENSLHNDDKRVNVLTGIATYTCLMTIFQCLAPFFKVKSSITCFQQLMLTLMKLRMNVTFDFLGFYFSIDPTTVSRYFKHCINLLYCRLVPSLVVWPERESLRTSLPYVFRNGDYENTVCIIDCFEIFLEKPSRLRPSAQCYSKYKSHHTMKYLIAISPQGSICFISTGWGGRTSDKFITEHSNFLLNILPGDIVLADRGFLVKESVERCLAKLEIPAFTRGKTQLDPVDIENTRSLASLRIHIERVIGVLRQKYSILESTVPITFTEIEKENDVTYLDKIVSVCCGLTNVSASVVPFE